MAAIDKLYASGRLALDMLISQGYVPSTCTLDDRVGWPLIWAEIELGRSPCWSCNADRSQCRGAPKRAQVDGGGGGLGDARLPFRPVG